MYVYVCTYVNIQIFVYMLTFTHVWENTHRKGGGGSFDVSGGGFIWIEMYVCVCERECLYKVVRFDVYIFDLF